MDKDEVLKLASLARVGISDAEAETLTHEFESILNYVGEVKGAGVKSKKLEKSDFPIRNVTRNDENPHETGIYTEELLKRAPNSDSEYIKVKKIL